MSNEDDNVVKLEPKTDAEPKPEDNDLLKKHMEAAKSRKEKHDKLRADSNRNTTSSYRLKKP
jgi:hypothetical protein